MKYRFPKQILSFTSIFSTLNFQLFESISLRVRHTGNEGRDRNPGPAATTVDHSFHGAIHEK